MSKKLETEGALAPSGSSREYDIVEVDFHSPGGTLESRMYYNEDPLDHAAAIKYARQRLLDMGVSRMVLHRPGANHPVPTDGPVDRSEAYRLLLRFLSNTDWGTVDVWMAEYLRVDDVRCEDVPLEMLDGPQTEDLNHDRRLVR